MLVVLLGLLSIISHASDNGYYYTCDDDISGWCIYTLVEVDNVDVPVPTEWRVDGAVPHEIDRDTDVLMRKLVDINGNTLSLSPKPWANGDDMVASTTPVTGDNWNFGLVFEMVAPLRNKLMFEPETIADLDEWNKYTRMFYDCGIKTDPDAINEHNMPETDTAGVYDWMTGSPTSHHTGLQYLEEGIIDLVCLVTELDNFDRCTVIRGLYDIDLGEKCDCWMPAYEALWGEEAQVDEPFVTCPGIVPGSPLTTGTDTTGDDEDDDEDTTPTGPHCCDGSEPSGGPPTCADGSTALAPTEECPEEESEEEEAPTGPHCCDGSEVDYNTTPPSCANGDYALPPTMSCDDDQTHSFQSKCTSEATGIIPLNSGDVNVYACSIESAADICGTDTALCTAEQIESMEEVCAELELTDNNFQGACDPETGVCPTCGDDASVPNGVLCCETIASEEEVRDEYGCITSLGWSYCHSTEECYQPLVSECIDLIEVDIHITQIRDCNHGLIQASELNFFDSYGVNMPLTYIDIENPHSPSYEQVDKLLDGNPWTKWLEKRMICGDNNGVRLHTSWVGEKPLYFTFSTGNDRPERDPTDMTLTICIDKVCHDPFRIAPLVPEDRMTSIQLQLLAVLDPDGCLPDEEIFCEHLQECMPAEMAVLCDENIDEHGCRIAEGYEYCISLNTCYLPGTLECPTLYEITFAFEEVRDCTSGQIQLSEIDFLDSAAQIIIWDSIVAVNPSNPANESPDNLWDGDYATKWLHVGSEVCSSDIILICTLDHDRYPVGYQFTTANDHIERDPTRWTVEVCVDTVCRQIQKHEAEPPVERNVRYPAHSLAYRTCNEEDLVLLQTCVGANFNEHGDAGVLQACDSTMCEVDLDCTLGEVSMRCIPKTLAGHGACELPVPNTLEVPVQTIDMEVYTYHANGECMTDLMPGLLIDSELDEHGCVTNAGYSWCPIYRRCTLPRYCPEHFPTTTPSAAPTETPPIENCVACGTCLDNGKQEETYRQDGEDILVCIDNHFNRCIPNDCNDYTVEFTFIETRECDPNENMISFSELKFIDIDGNVVPYNTARQVTVRNGPSHETISKVYDGNYNTKFLDRETVCDQDMVIEVEFTHGLEVEAFVLSTSNDYMERDPTGTYVKLCQNNVCKTVYKDMIAPEERRTDYDAYALKVPTCNIARINAIENCALNCPTNICTVMPEDCAVQCVPNATTDDEYCEMPSLEEADITDVTYHIAGQCPTTELPFVRLLSVAPTVSPVTSVPTVSPTDTCDIFKIDGEGEHAALLEGVYVYQPDDDDYTNGNRILYKNIINQWEILGDTGTWKSPATFGNLWHTDRQPWTLEPDGEPETIVTADIECVEMPTQQTIASRESAAISSMALISVAYASAMVQQSHESYKLGLNTYEEFLSVAALYGYITDDSDTNSFTLSAYNIRGAWNDQDFNGLYWDLLNQDPVYQITNTDYMQILTDFIEMLSVSHIKVACRPVFAELLDTNILGVTTIDFARMIDFMTSGDARCVDMTPEEIEELRHDPDNAAWGSCAGTSDMSGRGTTCGVWTLLHGMTVNKEGDDVIAYRASVDTISDFVGMFYGVYWCSICRRNFVEKTHVLEPYNLVEFVDDIHYLYVIHNLANENIAEDEFLHQPGGVRDPYYPKVQWPTTEMCCHCLEEIERSLAFVASFYHDDSVSDEELHEQLYELSTCSPSVSPTVSPSLSPSTSLPTVSPTRTCPVYKIDALTPEGDVFEGTFQSTTSATWTQPGAARVLTHDNQEHFVVTMSDGRTMRSVNTFGLNLWHTDETDWLIIAHNNAGDDEITTVTIDCVPLPEVQEMRSVDAAAIASMILVSVAYSAAEIQQYFQFYASGLLSLTNFENMAQSNGYGTAPFESTAYPVHGSWDDVGSWDLLHQDAVLQVPEDDFMSIVEHMVQYLSEAHVKTSCRDVFADLLDPSGAINPAAMSQFSTVGDARCSSLSPAEMEVLRNTVDHLDWGTCAGTTDLSTRGMNCGVWHLLHGLAAARTRNSDFSVSQSVEIITNFMGMYYGVVMSEAEREKLMMEMLVNTPFNPTVHQDDNHYLFVVHNNLNALDSAEEALLPGGVADPWYPKIQWPGLDMCCHCHENAPSAVYFLEAFYHDDSITDEEVASLVYTEGTCSPTGYPSSAPTITICDYDDNQEQITCLRSKLYDMLGRVDEMRLGIVNEHDDTREYCEEKKTEIGDTLENGCAE